LTITISIGGVLVEWINNWN